MQSADGKCQKWVNGEGLKCQNAKCRWKMSKMGKWRGAKMSKCKVQMENVKNG